MAKIVIDKNKYSTEQDFNLAIGNYINLLANDEYDVLIKYEDCGIYTIEYAHATYTKLGSDRFMLVTEDEEEHLRLERSFAVGEAYTEGEECYE